MGLDMYLFKRKKSTKNIIHKALEEDFFEEFEEVAYWRKANQIFNWFEQNLEHNYYDINGEYIPVTKANLYELLLDVKAVLGDESLAADILPSSEGFFFGSQEYNDYYLEQLEDSLEMLEAVLSDWEEDEEVFFLASY